MDNKALSNYERRFSRELDKNFDAHYKRNTLRNNISEMRMGDEKLRQAAHIIGDIFILPTFFSKKPKSEQNKMDFKNRT